jgi:alkanesulfonate monooxygenase SsuD/methylene tetrahydromethanopterin reductase-like flavin-dependent oxidoreductase (luciferase family)
MKFWQSASFSEPDQLVEIAKLAEEVGFDGVLVSDHLFFPEKLVSKYPYTPDGVPGFTPETPWPDPFALVGAMSSVTRRLRFATMVYILPLRNPLEVAKATATVDVLSGGRFILGVGAGWMKEEFDQLGVDFRTRGARFDESIEVLRKLWGGMVEHHGRFFDFPRCR